MLPDSVVVVDVIVVAEVNAASVDFSHLTTLPVLPLKVRSAGVVPEHIVCAKDTVPPTDMGSIITVAVLLVAVVQPSPVELTTQ